MKFPVAGKASSHNAEMQNDSAMAVGILREQHSSVRAAILNSDAVIVVLTCNNGPKVLVEGRGQRSIDSNKLPDMICLRRLPRSMQDDAG